MSPSQGGTGKVTSFDVARRAGVSRAAVSRTFTPHASVSPETRERVEKAAQELGYRVNYLARGLSHRRSDLVGVIAAGMDNPYRAMQIDHIAKALVRRNFRPILLPADQGESANHIMDQLLHYNVSGVLVTSDAPPSALCAEFAAAGAPIVLINKADGIPMVDHVISDCAAAGRLAVTTLIEAGAGCLAVMGSAAVSYTARRREEAFVAHCRALGANVQVMPVAVNDYANGYAAARNLAEVDGLFCINDYVACGVIDALRDGQEETSRRIKIMGHDDIPQAGWTAYDLTTIRQPCDIQADQAIDLLVSRMQNPTIDGRTEVTPVALIKRGTTAPSV
jgi:DNA-binding LacI/PurR family transcriptional regulator